MAVLRVVGVDADHLLLVDPDGGGHRVAIDGNLHDTLKQAAKVGQSRLSPREIQERLRSGATLEQVAEVAGVSVERVRRWEGPILAERARAIELALKTRYARPHDGAVSGPLGRLVTTHLDQLGLVGDWDARRGADGAWVVLVTHAQGQAAWRYDEGTLHALDPHAEAFGWREPPRAVDAPAPAPIREVGRRGRTPLPSWESIMENAPPPNAFPT
jgi:DNA-binding transcriptional regulator YiaG